MAQQFMDRMYRFPQGQGPQDLSGLKPLNQMGGGLRGGAGKGLLSDPGQFQKLGPAPIRGQAKPPLPQQPQPWQGAQSAVRWENQPMHTLENRFQSGGEALGSFFGGSARQQPNPQQVQEWNSLPQQGPQRSEWVNPNPGFQPQPRPMAPQTGGGSFAGAPTGGGFLASNSQPMGYNPPQQAAPQAPSQRDPAAVAARQAQRQQYLKRMGR